MNKNRFYTTLFLLANLFLGSVAWTQPITTENNYARNRPGIVMVQAIFSATVEVNRLRMDEGVFDNLVDSVKQLDTTGTILSPSQKLDIVVNALYKSPFRFFSSSPEYVKQVHRVQATGTGFLITNDGYLVTNCHIIDRDSAFIRNKFILSTYQEVTESNINALESSWAMTLTDQQRGLLYNAYGLIYSQVSSMILFDLKKEIFVLYRSDATKKGSVIMKKRAEVITKGRAMPGKDVAILKIQDGNNLPTLPLSNDSVVRIGAQVLVLGYPEPASSNSFLATEESIEPTLTSGIVSAIKRSVGGWPVIQMDAIISHGSSGSPVCNDKGEVIGLATFGSLDQGGSNLASGFNFAIPISVVKEFLDSAHIHPALSESAATFNKGLEYFFGEYYRKALRKFEAVKRLNDTYPQLNSYIVQCNSKIAEGADKKTPASKILIWVIAVIAILEGGYLLYRIRTPKVAEQQISRV